MIASQLLSIRSTLKGAPETIQRHYTRPSIIFDAKEAADTDTRTILPIALSGLEVLITSDDRFRTYKDTLFRESSLSIDRENMVPKDEEKLNRSISSFLRLLSDHFMVHAALETLEYLVRHYLVHIYNVDELVLCAFPYHDTHAFVRIVQLLDLRNKRWAFLEGVKSSAAPLPMELIVQQCICNRDLLEALCNYALPIKKFQESKSLVRFSTVVILKTFSNIPVLDIDNLQGVFEFVARGLDPDMTGGPEHKAGALLVAVLLATKSISGSKRIPDFVPSIAKMASQVAKQSEPSLHKIMVAINVILQYQPRKKLSKRTLMHLQEIGELSQVLLELSSESNMLPFLRPFVESLLDYSKSECCYLDMLCNMIKLPLLKGLVECIVPRVLTSNATSEANLHKAGKGWEKIIDAINQHHPSEFRKAVHRFLEDSKLKPKEEANLMEVLCRICDCYGGLDIPSGITELRLVVSLEHREASIRKAALHNIATSGNLKTIALKPQILVNFEDAIIRALYDEDLTIVQAALSIDELVAVVKPSSLVKAYKDILSRCMDIMNRGNCRTSQAIELSLLCLEHMVTKFHPELLDYSRDISTIIFPLLLVLPKTWRLNLKALALVKKVEWPFYVESSLTYDPSSSDKMKTFTSDYAASINTRTIGYFSKTFLANPEEHLPWLVECSNYSILSKNLFFFIILQGLMTQDTDFDLYSYFMLQDADNLLKPCQACISLLKNEWRKRESSGSYKFAEPFNVDELDKYCIGLVMMLATTDAEALNLNILICIFWSLVRRLSESASQTTLENTEHQSFLNELFLFFVGSPSTNLFRRHIQYLVMNCSGAPFQFISKYFLEEGFPVKVQVECLHLLATICLSSESLEGGNLEESSHLQLLLEFPSLLVPLANCNKDIRMAAFSCIEGLYKLWCCCDITRLRNGNDNILFRCVSSPTFGDFLESIFSQKKLIASDANFLPSYLTSMLSSSGGSIMVPENSHNRFEKDAKEAILFFILSSALKFPSYGKLMILSLLKGMGTAILKVEGVRSLLFKLLEKRKQSTRFGYTLKKLSENEIETLCLILQASLPASCSLGIDSDIVNGLLDTLKVDGMTLDDPAIKEPCLTILRSLNSAFYNNLKTELQDKIFANLVSLFREDVGDVRDATREVFLRIDLKSSTIVKFLDSILFKGLRIGSSKRVKKNKNHQNFGVDHDSFDKPELSFSALLSLLDILLLKKNVENRISLVRPLFEVLGTLFFDNKLLNLVPEQEKYGEIFSQYPKPVSGFVYQARHLALLVLKDITDSICSDPMEIENIFSDADMNILVQCARSSIDVATRNHVFSLLSSITRVSTKWVSEHIIEIFNVIGASALKQNDRHSQEVLEELIGTLVPCWLSTTRSIEKLLQIFIRALPDIDEHRRLSLLVFLLRILGEESSLGALFAHLFHALVQRNTEPDSDQPKYSNFSVSSSLISQEWEYKLAVQLCNQYSCKIWLPCLVKTLEEMKVLRHADGYFLETQLAMHFVLLQMQDTALVFELESGQNAEHLQVTLGELLEQVILQLQLIREKSKIHGVSADKTKEVEIHANKVLRIMTSYMVPSTFFKAITELLGHTDKNVKKKTLGLLCETVRNGDLVHKKRKDAKKMTCSSVCLLQIDDTAKQSFLDLCSKIVQLVDSTIAKRDSPIKLAAVASIEVLCKQFSSEDSVFITCLTTIVKCILSDDLALSSSCIRATGSLISVLSSKALSVLPLAMKHIIKRCREISECPAGQFDLKRVQLTNGILADKLSVLASALAAFEAIIIEFGGFLNPYLEDILDLVLLHPEYSSKSDPKIKTKASDVRKLLTTKVPVRLLLAPLLQMYPRALECGDISLSLTFEMLASLILTMDRTSIQTYHVKIFEQCLVSLDLRRRQPETVKSIAMVEQSITHAMVVLTMKLTEAMFRPLFLHTIEWAAGSVIEENDSFENRSIDRTISFYNLVNILVEKHRSLFVPYFKYLLENCIQYLMEDQDADMTMLKHKKKKAKGGNVQRLVNDNALSLKQWHLRALILKSLYQCFLYDTEQKFLDSSNFQVLLKPIVFQILVEPPQSLEQLPELPTVEEVDESLVSCLGQMAVTVRSDVLWKPLNHEVLMQTRSEKLRAKLLGLKVIKYLLEHLREEYLVFIPETIPFLSELIEDVELPVKTLAQEILKEMETLSGESLRQYL